MCAGEHISPLASLELPDAADAASVLASEAGALFVARASEAQGRADARRRERPRGARPVSPARRDPAGDRAGGGADEGDDPGRDPHAPRQTVPPPDRRSAHEPGTAPDPARRDRLVLRPAHRRRTRPARSLVGVRRWLRPRRRVAIAAGIGADEFEAFELLASLVAKSLVERNERDGVTRYRLLEMIRQYAAEQLNAGGWRRSPATTTLVTTSRWRSRCSGRRRRRRTTRRSIGSRPRPPTSRLRGGGCLPPIVSRSSCSSSTTCRSSTGSRFR